MFSRRVGRASLGLSPAHGRVPMTNEQFGLQSRMPFAVFDRGLSRWRTCQPSLDLGNLPEQSVIWPRSGMTRSGNAFELPMSVPLTGVSAASSLLGTPRVGTNGGHPNEAARLRMSGHRSRLEDQVALLKTPTAQLAVNGGSQHPQKRKQGGHGPTLADEVEHLLPTPRATDGTKGGPNQRGSSGDFMLPSAVIHLLPTPAAHDSGNSPEDHLRKKPGREQVTSLQVIVDHGLLPTGGRIDPQSSDGNASSDDQHHDQPSPPATETNDYHLF